MPPLSLPMKRLPLPYSITISRPSSPSKPVIVSIQLTTRVAVLRWATRFDVLATLTEPFLLAEGSTMWVCDLEAVYETEGFTVRAWFRSVSEAPDSTDGAS